MSFFDTSVSGSFLSSGAWWQTSNVPDHYGETLVALLLKIYFPFSVQSEIAKSRVPLRAYS